MNHTKMVLYYYLYADDRDWSSQNQKETSEGLKKKKKGLFLHYIRKQTPGLPNILNKAGGILNTGHYRELKSFRIVADSVASSNI